MCRTSPFLALLAALAFSLAACGEPPVRRIRNVVIVSLDALGALHTGAYGYERDTTPTLDRIAREGVVFASAYTQQLWTLSSHVTMLTGLYPKSHGATETRPASAKAITLAEILRREGFSTGAFTGVGGYMKPEFGLGMGFERYHVGRASRLDNEKRLRWLELQQMERMRDPDHRFFLFAHYYDIHSKHEGELPYSAPAPYRLRYLPDGLNWTRRGGTSLLSALVGKVTPRDREVLTALYDGAVRYCDERGLGRLVAKLRELGLDEETLLVVTSDHGEEIFEHGAPLHLQPYEETARVPLVMRGPGLPAGLRVLPIVELVDLMPTVLSLLDLPIPDWVQGQDLTPLLCGARPTKVAAHVDGIFGDFAAPVAHMASSLTVEIDGRRWSYLNTVGERGEGDRRVFHTHGPGELYLLDDDPRQQVDLLDRNPGIGERLRSALLTWYGENDAMARQLGRREEAESLLSEEEKRHMEALGYAR